MACSSRPDCGKPSESLQAGERGSTWLAQARRFQPPSHTLALTEYGLLYITMLAAPWLVREKGHVHIELVTAAVGPAHALLAHPPGLSSVRGHLRGDRRYYGLEVTIGHDWRAAMDVRSFNLPRWLLSASLPLSFGLRAKQAPLHRDPSQIDLSSTLLALA